MMAVYNHFELSLSPLWLDRKATGRFSTASDNTSHRQREASKSKMDSREVKQSTDKRWGIEDQLVYKSQ